MVLRFAPAPRFLPVALWLGIALLAPSTLLAGKDHCRLVELDGAASITSNDIVRIRVVDKTGRVLDQSCPIQVKGGVTIGESAIDFARRLPAVWGPGTGSLAEIGALCPPPTSGPVAPATTPNKTCGGINGLRACKHTFIYKVKSPPVLPQLLVCCTRSTASPAPPAADCKGKKLNKVKECIGGANAGALCVLPSDCASNVCEATTPLTIQIQRDGDPPGFNPGPVPPAQGGSTLQAALDPISVIQRALPTQLDCRALIGAAMTTLVTAEVQGLVRCHHEVMQGSSVPGVDCNSTDNADPGTQAKIASAVAALHTVINEECAPKGSPTTFGYGQCPAPCNSIPGSTCTAGTVPAPCTRDPDCDSTHTCTAGTVGLSCLNDAECDTTPGNGRCEGSLDGRCGNWNGTADCLTCLAGDIVSTAIEDKYGTPGPGPGLPPEVQRCQDEIGKTLAFLAATQVTETVRCQKLVDVGKGALGFCRNGECTAPPDRLGLSCATEDDCAPMTERLCKFADPKGRRAHAEAFVADALLKGCDDLSLAQLDSCDTTVFGLQQCVRQNGRDLGQAIADAIFP